ncbi:MAG: hypothetical protein DRO00_05045 [Thermoproteota archaeon]|nr:MAG: hypothetical protein DRO00_05045 [Candidatus Korarchaeota archaeon]
MIFGALDILSLLLLFGTIFWIIIEARLYDYYTFTICSPGRKQSPYARLIKGKRVPTLIINPNIKPALSQEEEKKDKDESEDVESEGEVWSGGFILLFKKIRTDVEYLKGRWRRIYLVYPPGTVPEDVGWTHITKKFRRHHNVVGFPIPLMSPDRELIFLLIPVEHDVPDDVQVTVEEFRDGRIKPKKIKVPVAILMERLAKAERERARAEYNIEILKNDIDCLDRDNRNLRLRVIADQVEIARLKIQMRLMIQDMKDLWNYVRKHKIFRRAPPEIRELERRMKQYEKEAREGEKVVEQLQQEV